MPTEIGDHEMHFVVAHLIVPESWRVGTATLRPAGWLADHLGDHKPSWPERFDPLHDSRWPTIGVPVVNVGAEDAVAVARNVARDSLAVLDLYRRARLPLAPMEAQSFGLAVDVASAEEHRWITDANGALAQASASRFGSLGPWTFTRDDVDAFRRDPRFAYVDDALRTLQPTDLEARTVTAIRTLALSRLVIRPALRVVLLATAIEALLGDPYREAGPGTGAHQLARRAAFAWCGSDSRVGRHGIGRPACSYLTSKDARELNKEIRAGQERGEPTICSAYWHLRDLSRDRGRALHGARLDFPARDVRMHEWVVRGVVLTVLDWITVNGATRFAEYEAAIKAVPREMRP